MRPAGGGGRAAADAGMEVLPREVAVDDGGGDGDGDWLPLVARSVIAIVVAPAAAPPAALLTMQLLVGDPVGALLGLPFVPLVWITIAGIYGTLVAFGPVLVLGPALTLAARRIPLFRRKRAWAAAGALGGIAVGIAFGAFAPEVAAVGAVAGAASALTYRLILGRALSEGR